VHILYCFFLIDVQIGKDHSEFIQKFEASNYYPFRTPMELFETVLQNIQISFQTNFNVSSVKCFKIMRLGSERDV
jgi:hypothetical protein